MRAQQISGSGRMSDEASDYQEGDRLGSDAGGFNRPDMPTHNSQPAPFEALRQTPGTPPPGAELAAWLFMARRLREEVLGAHLFSDPAWDILLDVYAADARGDKIQISSLSPMTNVPSSTARRWAHKLIELGLLERERDERDHRLTYIRLSDEGRRRIMTFIGRLIAKSPPPPIMR
jgi:DNA-binding MarR family transcriptional regulator